MPELLYIVDDNHCTPLCRAVALHLNNPEFIQAVASLAPDAAKILNIHGNNLLHTLTSKFNVFRAPNQSSTGNLGNTRAPLANKLASMRMRTRNKQNIKRDFILQSLGVDENSGLDPAYLKLLNIIGSIQLKVDQFFCVNCKMRSGPMLV
eukprot:gene34024-43959_t